MNSCSVVKCRYRNGWNIGLDRGLEYTEKSSIRKSKRDIHNEQSLSQDSLFKTTFATLCNSNSIVSTFDGNSFFSAASKSLHEAKYTRQQIEKDSNKYSQKNKRKSKTRRRYQSSVYDFIPDNEYEYILFIFLIGIIIIGFILWALYSLIRLFVRALRRDKDLPPDNSTVSPKCNDSMTAVDPSQKETGVNQESTFEGDTTFDHSNEMAENTEENVDLEDDNKSKLLSFFVVVALTLGLVTLMALGMQNQ
jgi:hypothetical protein